MSRIFKFTVKHILPLFMAFAFVYPLLGSGCAKKIEFKESSVDFNKNGVDDYTDILNGARIDAVNKPTYDDRYWDEGYPPDNYGVCTDVVWRAFKHAGYNLREMVDKDVNMRLDEYTNISVPDDKIDFRRVKNLKVFFDKYAISLTTNINDVGAWQAGDIVIFNRSRHIGIISDQRNIWGQPYVIHNGGQDNREEDYLSKSPIVAHYRFDASRVPDNMLIPFE